MDNIPQTPNIFTDSGPPLKLLVGGLIRGDPDPNNRPYGGMKKYFSPPIGGVRGIGGTFDQPPYYLFYRGSGICKNLGGLRYIGRVGYN